MKVSFCVLLFKLITVLRFSLTHDQIFKIPSLSSRYFLQVVGTLMVHLVKGTSILKYLQDPQK